MDLSIVCHLDEFFTIQVNVLALGVFISTLRTVLVVLDIPFSLPLFGVLVVPNVNTIDNTSV